MNVMTMKTTGYGLRWLAVVTLLFAGCGDVPEPDMAAPDAKGGFSVRFETRGALPARGEDAAFDDAAVGRVTGFRFEQGILRERLEGDPLDGGVYRFYPAALAGEIRFVANVPQSVFGALEPGVATIEEFLDCDAAIGDMVADRVAMTGRMALPAAAGGVPMVRMTRSVARIDLVSEEQGVEVRSVRIASVADRGYVADGERVRTSDKARRVELVKSYEPAAFANRSEVLSHLCEQSGEPLVAEVVAAFGGGLHRMRAAFPSEVRRNRIYTLRVHGAGAGASVSVAGAEWEEGDSAETSPEPQGVIDLEASLLPDGATVNPSRDTVRMASHGGTLRLVLRAGAGAEVVPDGTVRGVTTSVEPAVRALEPVATVTVTSTPRFPGEARAYLGLTLREGTVQTGQVVVVFEPNPVQLSGSIVLDEQGVCDFGRYVEGELGRMVLPEGKVAHVEFGEGEDAWLKLSGEEGAVRILAGWKPNDPKADGRVQEGYVVVSDAGGAHPERYVVRRRNWGLPVVRIGGMWWCKYNLRGNVKEFADQVRIQDDAVADEELARHLTTCGEEELLRLMGDQYQASNRGGLPLRHNGTAFFYEGMSSSAQNFGSIPAEEMAPEGYRVPNLDDYSHFAASRNSDLGGVGTKSYRSMKGETVTVQVLERRVTWLGHDYGTVRFCEFRIGDACWTLFGLGHQWNTTAGMIAPQTLLLATSGDGANCWVLDRNDAGKSLLKYEGHNSTKTRAVRCVKSPVEYVYH